MLKTWARFIRLPNCFTAMADPVAGLAIGTAAAQVAAVAAPSSGIVQSIGPMGPAPAIPAFSWAAAGWLAGAGFLIYAAGIIFNDIADLKGDRLRRPERALPSGAISVGTASVMGLLLGGVGVSLAWLAGAWAGMVAGAVCLAVLLYDFVFKRSVFTAAPAMGLCRALNLCMGMVIPFQPLLAHYSLLALPPFTWLPMPALYLLLISFLTTLSWTEERFPIKLTPNWKLPPKDSTAATTTADGSGSTPPVAPPSAPVLPPKPSTAPARISFWLWVACMWFMGQIANGMGRGGGMMSMPGMIQFVTMLGVFIFVYMQFSLFLSLPTRPNLGLTIRNGVLSLPLLWCGLVYAFSRWDATMAAKPFAEDFYLLVALLMLALYGPIVGAAKWLNTKDA